MRKISVLFILIMLVAGSTAQTYFRSGIFLHHSTGEYTWGPNPDGTSTTTIPIQMTAYNSLHTLSGPQAVTLNEEWWSPAENEWEIQHEFFEGNTLYTDINFYLNNNKIIVVKSCFPSSEIDDWGQASDTNSPDYKTVYNYKWHWRHIIRVMGNHPDNFFAIWTNAPLESSSTTLAQAMLSKQFCTWAKDTLANGLDPEFGAFPPNVYVFDFFRKLTDANGVMLNIYRTSEWDSHPNGAATDLIAPQFVNEIFDAAIAYESVYTGLENTGEIGSAFSLCPNPASDGINLEWKNPDSEVQLRIWTSCGQLLYEKTIMRTGAGYFERIDLSTMPKGILFLQAQSATQTQWGKIIR